MILYDQTGEKIKCYALIMEALSKKNITKILDFIVVNADSILNKTNLIKNGHNLYINKQIINNKMVKFYK